MERALRDAVGRSAKIAAKRDGVDIPGFSVTEPLDTGRETQATQLGPKTPRERTCGGERRWVVHWQDNHQNGKGDREFSDAPAV
jgi:hypothetical protein